MFYQRRPVKDGDDPKFVRDGWVWKLDGVRRVPYCLPQLIKAVRESYIIYIPEGEKDCNNLMSRGLEATTNPGGANEWQDSITQYFRGADVVLIADNDKPGRAHVADVAQKLTGFAKRVRLLDIGSVWSECPLKGDISDWLKCGHSAEELGAIVARLPDWRPPSISERRGVLDAGDLVTLPPPRAWLYGNLFARKFLSSLFGDGGVGKTALRYAQYMSLATGRSLAGDHVFQRCRVLIISLEDDIDELKRRIWALRIHYKISEADLKGWLFLWAPGVKGGKLMTLDKHGNPITGELSTNLESLIVENKLDLIGIDPFIKSHGVGENDNNAIDQVAQVFSDLMIKHNISVDVPHHVSKAGAKEAEPGDANRGRGATAMKDAARLVYTLNVMTKQEAKNFGINEHDRSAYIRMDKGKVNIAPPARKAVWFHLIGVRLGNQTEMYPHGDEVQAVEPWFPPDMFQDVSDEHMEAIIADVDAGMGEGVRYTNHPQAKTRAAWKVVVKHVPTVTEPQAQEIIATWVKSGVLLSREYWNEKVSKKEDGLFENKEREKDNEIPFGV